MKTIIKKIWNSIFEIITWHVLPKKSELGIKSIVEFVFYILLTFALIGCFYLWHKIPERNIVISFDKTHNSHFIHTGDSTSVDVQLTIPMTIKDDVNNDDFIYNLNFRNWPCNNHSYTSTPIDSSSLNAVTKELLDSLNKNNSLYDYFVRRKPELKNKYMFYYGFGFSRGTNSVSSAPETYLYSWPKIYPTPMQKVDNQYVLDTLFSVRENNFTRKIALAKRFVCRENLNINIEKEAYSRDVLSKPVWYRLEDISQSYYNILLSTNTIDSISLKINYVGATEFSLMSPQPDDIGMNYIAFYNQDKIRQIKSSGLKYHAKFKEIENMQTIRLLGITTLLGGILVIFMGMIFVASYYLIRWGARFYRYSIPVSVVLIIVLFLIYHNELMDFIKNIIDIIWP